MPTIFLSPSTQEYNEYVNGGNEEQYMNLIADAMIPYLESTGINYVRNDPSGTVGNSIRSSNSGNYDFHLAIHSNAAAPSNSGNVRGTDVYYFPGSAGGERFANIAVDEFQDIYPLPNRVKTIASSSLAELRKTRAPAALIEVAYHDNVDDANWIKNNIDPIARALVMALAEYFGIPFAG